jgi:nanoRNase/pAp phosphatase (c-di-AMP/oligoRNAs hydrolase)
MFKIELKNTKMDQNIKQQIIESINGTTNVLVTVSSNPSVDELAACIGLTLVLNKLGKHATAVFSGKVPSTLEFLKPDETLETNTDSLRDFIISLDKSKADKLRYKVEDEVVKIFITPYKTSIGQKDLEFSQGDFNVDVVVALGVHKREELDKAIVAHGRILHDATVVCVNHDQVSNLGVYNWQDAEASSLCEMVVDLAETIKPDNFDAQMATSLLTGIVAETARFSNEKTSPRTMSLAAKLMAAGANQQLVASKLQTNLDKSEVAQVEDEEEDTADGGTLRIAHKKDDDEEEEKREENPFVDEEPELDELEPPEESVEEEPLEKPQEPKKETRLEPTGNVTADDVNQAPDDLPLPNPAPAQTPPPPPEPTLPQAQIKDVKTGSMTTPPPPPSVPQDVPRPNSKLTFEPPVMGGTLTANSRPEPFEPSSDGMSLPTPQNAPILNHAPSNVGQDTSDKAIINDETVSHIEKTIGSPHADAPGQAAPALPDLDALNEAAKDAATENVDPNQLGPLAAAGSSPLDMNVQASAPPPPMPNPPAPTASPMPPQPTVSPQPLNNLPPQLVPPDSGLPPEQTASGASQPLPPPVPPPFVPEIPPQPSDNQNPLPPLPPAGQ